MKFKLLIPTLLYTFLSSFCMVSPQALQTNITTTTTIATTAFDSDGHEVQPGSKYYISPVGRSNDDSGGGLSLASRDGFCPPFVIQENNQLSRGLSLRFLPLDSKQNSIALSSDLNIVFNAATICVTSTVWRLSNGVGGRNSKTDEGVAAAGGGRRYYVRSGGVVGRPGVGTVTNWFRIEKVNVGDDIGYKFVFCPSVCGSSSCKVVCGDVGVLEENGKKWLGLINDDQPFLFTFKKA